MTKSVRVSLFTAFFAVAVVASASAECITRGIWSKETYCFGEPAPIFVPPVFQVTPGELSEPFLNILRQFEPLTGAASLNLALPAPISVEELDSRVTNFYASTHRDNDYLVQGIDRLNYLISSRQQGIVEVSNYIQSNQSIESILTFERDKLQADFNDRVAAKVKWQQLVSHLRTVTNDFSTSAHYARQSIVDLVAEISPSEGQLLSYKNIETAENLWSQFPTPPQPNTELPNALAAADSASSDVWRPLDRTLNIDLSAPREIKLDSLLQLYNVMKSNADYLDASVVTLKSKDVELRQLFDQKQRLDATIIPLRLGIEGLAREIVITNQDVTTAKNDSLQARDQLAVRAVQDWIWRSSRDELVIPEVQTFLQVNGFNEVAEKLGADGIIESMEAVRSISWSDVLGVRGLDEFKAVQEKVINLLNPTQSSILQSAEINAWATPEEGQRFAQGIFERLGDDAVEFFNAAGQVNVDEHYQGLLKTLLGDMGPRRTAEEL